MKSPFMTDRKPVGAIVNRDGAYQCGNAWNNTFWSGLPVFKIDQFHARSSDHHPLVQARLAYDEEGIAACFRVEDRYVICRHTQFMSPVCQDSCVEFFFQPGGADGYFNIEVNCGGAVHASYIRNHLRLHSGFADWTPLKPEHGEQIRVFSDLPAVMEPEIQTPLTWTLAFYVPFQVLAQYCGAAAYGRNGWKGNLYKCADQSSHPHWASWQAVEPLNFHQPQFFAPLSFATE